MNRYVCVHAHFYQPPRENPWLEAIEQQDSAYPYHDWNERIAAECYGPNAHARILDGRDRINRIVNNYASISFNFGPTLHAWLEEHEPDIHARVVRADRESVERFGAGSAIAQAYNHLIMPLASARDRVTQVHWGIRDFEHRFGRRPEGMWLPETAVDTATLEVLAAARLRFTVLAPRQAAAVRAPDSVWRDVSGGRIDPTRPYLCRLPSGRSITIFFYDGPVSQAVAFEGLLESGERLVGRIRDIFSEGGPATQLAHIATDGETYGHHHRHGEMALAWALRQLEVGEASRLINYAAFLSAHPPEDEVRIVERSSWSCVHGVERWRSDCGCHTGGAPGWTQAWRTPLRQALDWLRDSLAPRYEAAAAELVFEPWSARDAYIDVILDRSSAAIAAFAKRHARRKLDHRATVRLLKLLEMQRHAMLMYTSCGWFFNDLAGIETIQVLQYAARAAQLAEELFGESFEDPLIERLAAARSNDPASGDGRRIYEEHVRPARVDLMHVAAHHAVSSIFDGGTAERRVYCYDVEETRHARRSMRGTTLAVGRATVRSRITLERETVSWAVMHFGDHHISGGIRRHASEDEHADRADALLAAFDAGDLPTVVGMLADFPEYAFSLKSLFSDRQREILHGILETRTAAAEQAYRHVFDANADLMRYLLQMDLPLPRAITMAADFTLNSDLRRALGAAEPDLDRARTLLDAASAAAVPLDREGIAFAASRALVRAVERVASHAGEATPLEQLADLVALVRTLPFDVDLWEAQNGFYALVEEGMPAVRERAHVGDAPAARWLELLRIVGDQLSVAVP